MLIMTAIFSTISWYVRYRYLNMYARLPPEPQRKEPEIDLFPDTHEEGIKSSLSNYLDEFLSAIKIFGYLERSVFHELTRSMMTRKLIAGETLNLEEEKGFCIVVDGLVEIFVKSSHDRHNVPNTRAHPFFDSDSSDDSSHGPPRQRYQLLTEVRNGAPMSSLFSIMSLFTEDVKLRHSDDDNSEPQSAATGRAHPVYPLSADFRKSEVPVSFPTTPQFRTTAGGGPIVDESPRPATATNGSILPNVPPLALEPEIPATQPTRPPRPMPKRAATNSVHPDIIARATVDTTIAIIPASAFRRLIRIYPKATAHIVHVILSRFQRVTLATAYNYLGLTGEVLQTERNMINYTMAQLPNYLRGDALERLKEKFHRERERIGDEDIGKGIALHNPATGRRRRSTTTLRKEAALQSIARQRPASIVAAAGGAPRDRASISNASPGDLMGVSKRAVDRSSSALSTIMSSPRGDESGKAGDISPLAQRTFNPFATDRRGHGRIPLDKRETLDEDNIFREAVLECVFKAIGLTSSGTSSREPESIEGSPRLVSFENSRHRSVSSSNAFGFMDPFTASADGDAESMTSSSIPTNVHGNAQMLARDMRDELEIVYFRKGSVLVEQGGRSPGLYYVIDGFLDICISGDEHPDDILQSAAKTPLSAGNEDPFSQLRRSSMHDSRTSIPDVDWNTTSARNRRSSGRSVALIKPGGLAGYIGTVSSHRSFTDVVAKTDVYVGFLPRASLERIVDRHPIVLLTMAKRLTNILPRLILHIDFALEWLQVDAGQVIFHKGEESEAIYIVLNGRLRLVEDRKAGGVAVRAEYGQGDSVGELEVLTESARSGTLHAIRATELVKFPRTLFNSLAQEHPNITIKISKIIASRMRKLIDDPSADVAKDGTVRASITKSSAAINLRTVAILPVTAGVPVVEFGNKLMNALAQVGVSNGVTSLNQAAILNHLGKHAFNKIGKLKLSQYLADLEEKYGLVVYVAGKSASSPTQDTARSSRS